MKSIHKTTILFLLMLLTGCHTLPEETVPSFVHDEGESAQTFSAISPIPRYTPAPDISSISTEEEPAYMPFEDALWRRMDEEERPEPRSIEALFAEGYNFAKLGELVCQHLPRQNAALGVTEKDFRAAMSGKLNLPEDFSRYRCTQAGLQLYFDSYLPDWKDIYVIDYLLCTIPYREIMEDWQPNILPAALHRPYALNDDILRTGDGEEFPVGQISFPVFERPGLDEAVEGMAMAWIEKYSDGYGACYSYSWGERFVSVVLTGATNDGGVHPNELPADSLCYDLDEARVWALEDIFAPGADYLAPLSVLVRNELEARGLEIQEEYSSGKRTAPVEGNFERFALTDDGLMLYWPTQTLAARVVGEFAIYISLTRKFWIYCTRI